MNDEKNIQPQVTKRHGSKPRPNRIEVILSDQEYEHVSALAERAGEKTVANFIREFIMKGGKITAALSKKEIQEIDKLNNIGTNLWEVRKQILNSGFDDKTAQDLYAFKQEFTEILAYYKSKKKKKIKRK